MKKNRSEKLRWISLLKRDLYQFPPHGKDYCIPENLIITITARKNIKKRHYTFGGPHYSAILNFSDPLELEITFLSPSRKPFFVKWGDIIEITVRHISNKVIKKLLASIKSVNFAYTGTLYAIIKSQFNEAR